MSFRQFPAVGADGEPYVIIEFRDDQPQGARRHTRHHAMSSPTVAICCGRANASSPAAAN